MLIEESMLEEFRDVDGFCHLKPEYDFPRKYIDYPKKMSAEQIEAAKRPNLLRDGSLKIIFAREYFDELSDNGVHGVVAMLVFTNLVPVLPITRNWIAFQHQGAGVLCRNMTFIGCVLEPKPAVRSAFFEIARTNYYACGGRFEGPEADATVTKKYIADIQELGLSCGVRARGELCESVYPVDANPVSMGICFDDVGDLLHLTDDEPAQPMILFLSSNSD